MSLLSLRIQALATHVLGGTSENSEENLVRELQFELQETHMWQDIEAQMKRLEEATLLLTRSIENLERECLIVADGALMDRVAVVEMKMCGAVKEAWKELALINRVQELEKEMG